MIIMNDLLVQMHRKRHHFSFFGEKVMNFSFSDLFPPNFPPVVDGTLFFSHGNIKIEFMNRGI
jgi:hypothetical protein